MNDTELDDMLNQWEAPEVPARLRDSIVLPRPPKRRIAWPSWHLSKGLLAGALAGAAMCFIGIATAFPQVLAPSSGFYVVSEYIEHKADGSSVAYEDRVATAQHGREIILKRHVPNNLFMDLHMRFFDTVHRLLGLEHEGPAGMGSDCSIPGLSVIGHETVLNYQTIRQRTMDKDGSRYTEWRAPDLECIVMKYTKEEPVNGELTLTDERRPMFVKLNRAQ